MVSCLIKLAQRCCAACCDNLSRTAGALRMKGILSAFAEGADGALQGGCLRSLMHL